MVNIHQIVKLLYTLGCYQNLVEVKARCLWKSKSCPLIKEGGVTVKCFSKSNIFACIVALIATMSNFSDINAISSSTPCLMIVENNPVIDAKSCCMSITTIYSDLSQVENGRRRITHIEDPQNVFQYRLSAQSVFDNHTLQSPRVLCFLDG